jgi:hypothetical protein
MLSLNIFMSMVGRVRGCDPKGTIGGIDAVIVEDKEISQ